jgi:outer membrane protein assembly factor BamD
MPLAQSLNFRLQALNSDIADSTLMLRFSKSIIFAPMLKKTSFFVISFLVILVLITSCSRFNRIMKSTDMNMKYEAAMKYYNAKKYYQALQLFEELISVFKGTARAEQTYYYYCKSYYETGEYQTAAYHLDNFTKTFPNSEHAEECQYLNAYCYYLDSPIYSLDQTSTHDAIKQFQLFINKYPKSPRVEESNRLIDQLRLKLETKAFMNAKLYYKMEEYKAATIAFAGVMKDFPTTQYKEECMFLIIKSAYKYAENSIESKKKNRYKDAIEQYYKLVDAFPNSKYLREGESIFNDSKEEIKKLEKEKTVTLNQ